VWLMMMMMMVYSAVLTDARTAEKKKVD